MANDNYINQITATDGITYDIKDTVSGYTTNTGTVTGMTTTAGTHTAGAQTVSGGIITTNIPTKTSHLTNDSGFITTDSDEKLKIGEVANNTTNTTYYPILATNSTAAATRYYDSTGIYYNNVNGSTTAVGKADLVLGNSTASGSANNKKGTISLYSSTSSYGYFTTADLTAQRTYTFPDKTGTVALTSDNTDTTYTLSGSLNSHKFTSTLTAGGSGSGTSESDLTLAAGTGISITDDTTNKKMTIACTITNTDTKVSTAAVTSDTQYYPIVGTNTTSAATKYYDVDYGYLASSGTTSALGYGRLKLGNTTASGTAGNKYGMIRLCGTGAKYIDFRAQTVTSNRTLDLPDISGNMLAVDSNKLLSSPVKAQASDGTAERVVNIKYGSAAPSGSATTGTVYFQTGSSAYTFQPRVNLPSLSASTTLREWTHFTLPVGLYLITFQVNCNNINTYNLRVDLIAGSNTITQIRSGNGSSANGLILNGAGLVECTSSTTIYFKAQTSSSSVSNCELHYSYVKLF